MNRRTFLAGAAAAAALTRLPRAEAAEKSTFVLLHGAWHNSLTWSRVGPLLTAKGHRTLALDLLGHGVNAQFPAAWFESDRSGMLTEPSPLRDLTLDQAASAVLDALPGKVVLVGHSMAGHILSRVAERAPERIQRLVYLAAFMPVSRPSFADYIALPEAKTEMGLGYALGDPQKLGASRIDPRSLDPAYLDRLHKTFYGDVDLATFRAFGNGLTPDQPLHFFTDSPKITRERWGKVPRTYLVTERDQAISAALQRLFIAEADRYTPGNPTRVVSLLSSHSPFASQPERLAEVLAAQT